ncbi:integral membrane protein DUF92 [Xylaria bambusicola]|uniref:integral membrane protein DUF92 n=1 Tax=Xylaria bambusicola TaxID=326684 RepID=UPI00200727C8|nr:integral membrane protein DUF92 [Xylaria bambusicola]KAI0514478.1 integral membrane protein DUF92 [Xylaria bambusicola]
MKAIYAVPACLALVYRAYSHNSLTPFGIFVAGLTAAVHAYHPWNLPFVLLIIFFLAGTRATAVKKEVKASLTLNAQGSEGGEGPRTHVQVLANSLMASILTLLHTYQLHQRREAVWDGQTPSGTYCYSWKGDLLVVGIIANYAAVCADTFSSELGILSRTEPRLITSLNLRKVPRGTNGGVTVWGLVAGFLGSTIIVVTSLMFLPLCSDHTSRDVAGGRAWSKTEIVYFALGMTIWGTLGSLLDSFLGGWLQRSVRDVRTGKIVEGEGGARVRASADTKKATQLVGGQGSSAVGSTSAVDDSTSAKDPYNPKDKHRKASFGDNKPTRVAETGWDLLDNNDVNFLMAFTMSVGGMLAASWYWDVPIASILQN